MERNSEKEDDPTFVYKICKGTGSKNFDFKKGDIIQIFTYKGTRISTCSMHFHSITMDEELENEDGLEFIAKYFGRAEPGPYGVYGPELTFQILNMNPGFAYTCPAEIGMLSPEETTRRPDLTIAEKFIRRYNVLGVQYESPALPLEEEVRT